MWGILFPLLVGASEQHGIYPDQNLNLASLIENHWIHLLFAFFSDAIGQPDQKKDVFQTVVFASLVAVRSDFPKYF